MGDVCDEKKRNEIRARIEAEIREKRKQDKLVKQQNLVSNMTDVVNEVKKKVYEEVRIEFEKDMTEKMQQKNEELLNIKKEFVALNSKYEEIKNLLEEAKDAIKEKDNQNIFFIDENEKMDLKNQKLETQLKESNERANGLQKAHEVQKRDFKKCQDEFEKEKEGLIVYIKDKDVENKTLIEENKRLQLQLSELITTTNHYEIEKEEFIQKIENKEREFEKNKMKELEQFIQELEDEAEEKVNEVIKQYDEDEKTQRAMWEEQREEEIKNDMMDMCMKLLDEMEEQTRTEIYNEVVCDLLGEKSDDLDEEEIEKRVQEELEREKSQLAPMMTSTDLEVSEQKIEFGEKTYNLCNKDIALRHHHSKNGQLTLPKFHPDSMMKSKLEHRNSISFSQQFKSRVDLKEQLENRESQEHYIYANEEKQKIEKEKTQRISMSPRVKKFIGRKTTGETKVKSEDINVTLQEEKGSVEEARK
ncbi:DNA double-strand break repair Rad50 ATPase, putative [Entamoeba invadens IP1]|uniref:DNA double-strand break repair Rad50 ATPase, putative n=1 Tax=Entamoeba invadens IP1 TaxID=370355 RepID=A0A0A1UBB4_ENTIV|nr:DNA double-strand break repair Rad50 ATPase, putative [Entamoeba invadens IP1]ELP92471.1 DNA double-strand break repair Rad50 ATPase, putative [Entamoeba invadens IP1]|eukprot:XP_004259242.1 DNA double-strand break repair Rad50 ATPase, putative [Entamoeba invadens IP1]